MESMKFESVKLDFGTEVEKAMLEQALRESEALAAAPPPATNADDTFDADL